MGWESGCGCARVSSTNLQERHTIRQKPEHCTDELVLRHQVEELHWGAILHCHSSRTGDVGLDRQGNFRWRSQLRVPTNVARAERKNQPHRENEACRRYDIRCLLPTDLECTHQNTQYVTCVETSSPVQRTHRLHRGTLTWSALRSSSAR